jgi:hypothetical protein
MVDIAPAGNPRVRHTPKSQEKVATRRDGRRF